MNKSEKTYPLPLLKPNLTMMFCLFAPDKGDVISQESIVQGFLTVDS